MPVIKTGDRPPVETGLSEQTWDIIAKVFRVGLIVTALLYVYMLYIFVSGDAANVGSAASHAGGTLSTLISVINVCLVVTLAAAILLFSDDGNAAVMMLALAGFCAYGFNYAFTYLDPGAHKSVSVGAGPQAILQEMWRTAIALAAAGAICIIRTLASRIMNAREVQQKAQHRYGGEAIRDVRKPPGIGMMAKCWQLPYCRESVKVHCPIYHARSKCWKQRSGCMCEEQIVRVALSAGAAGTSAPQTAGGFVPIGDVIARSASAASQLPTRLGPRGVKIPFNPNLSAGERRERCRNCVIYNEHQRLKYQVVAPLTVAAVPLIIWWQFNAIVSALRWVIEQGNALISQVSVNGHVAVTAGLAKSMTGSLTVEVIMVACAGLIILTWSVRFVEYCVFKLKI